MATLDYANFLQHFADWLGAAASLQRTAPGRQLWQHSAVEQDAGDPYTVLRISGGEVPKTPVARFSIQSKTTGTSVDAAQAQAAAAYAALLDASGRPLRMVAVSLQAGAVTFRLQKAEPRQMPSFLSRDERRRAEVIFNFDLSVVPL